MGYLFGVIFFACCISIVDGRLGRENIGKKHQVTSTHHKHKARFDDQLTNRFSRLPDDGYLSVQSVQSSDDDDDTPSVDLSNSYLHGYNVMQGSPKDTADVGDLRGTAQDGSTHNTATFETKNFSYKKPNWKSKNQAARDKQSLKFPEKPRESKHTEKKALHATEDKPARVHKSSEAHGKNMSEKSRDSHQSPESGSKQKSMGSANKHRSSGTHSSSSHKSGTHEDLSVNVTSDNKDASSVHIGISGNNEEAHITKVTQVDNVKSEKSSPQRLIEEIKNNWLLILFVLLLVTSLIVNIILGVIGCTRRNDGYEHCCTDSPQSGGKPASNMIQHPCSSKTVGRKRRGSKSSRTSHSLSRRSPPPVPTTAPPTSPTPSPHKQKPLRTLPLWAEQEQYAPLFSGSSGSVGSSSVCSTFRSSTRRHMKPSDTFTIQQQQQHDQQGDHHVDQQSDLETAASE